MHTADFPTAQHFARDAMIQILLPWSRWELIKIAQDKGMRNVLITDALLGLQVVRVLRAEDVGIEPGEGWKTAIGVGQGL